MLDIKSIASSTLTSGTGSVGIYVTFDNTKCAAIFHGVHSNGNVRIQGAAYIYDSTKTGAAAFTPYTAFWNTTTGFLVPDGTHNDYYVTVSTSAGYEQYQINAYCSILKK